MLQSTNNRPLQTDEAVHVSVFVIGRNIYLVAAYHQTQCSRPFPYGEFILGIKVRNTEGFPGIGGAPSHSSPCSSLILMQNTLRASTQDAGPHPGRGG